MSIVIVPNHVSAAIYAKVDEAIAKCPDAAPDREFYYSRILSYFDQHGEIPEFELKAKVLSDVPSAASHADNSTKEKS